METSDILGHLGLKEKQALVYATLLELGPSTAYAIAKKSGLKRPTVYVVLEELRQRDAILKIPHAKKQVFLAKSPNELYSQALSRIQETAKYLPALLGLMAKEGRPKILYYEGIAELRQMLWRSLPSIRGQEVLGFYAYSPDLPKRMMDLIDEYNEESRRHRVYVRGIVPEHRSLSKYRKKDSFYLRTILQVPINEYSSKISVEVGEDFVRLIDYAGQQGLLIENSNVAKSVKQIFEMVWEHKSH